VVIANFLFTIVFLFLGVIFSFLEKRKYRYPFLLSALGPSLGLILILGIPSTDQFRNNFLDFSVPAFVFFSVFLAIGSNGLMNRYVNNKMIHVFLLIILLLTQAAFNFPRSSHHNDRLAEIWATELLHSLKPNSILIVCGASPFEVYFLQLIRGIRKDVTQYDRLSIFTKSNLYTPNLIFKMKDNAREYRKKREMQLVANSARPIYYTCKDPIDGLPKNYSNTPYALRADNNHAEASDVTQFPISDRLLEILVSGYPKSDVWVDDLRRTILDRLITYYGRHDSPEVSKILEYFKKSKLYSSPQFILPLANNLYFFQNYRLASSFYGRAQQLDPDAFSSTDLAVYCNLLANAKDFNRALDVCLRQERTAAPCEENTVITRQTIAAIYKDKKDWRKVAQYSRRILECQPEHPLARSYLQSAMQGIEKRQSATELIANDEAKKEK